MNRISSEISFDIYKRWLVHCYPETGHERLKWTRNFEQLKLHYGDGRDFDLFVFGCGGAIRQEHHKRFIEFADSSNMTLFVLRWA
jgi:hypothetical protein